MPHLTHHSAAARRDNKLLRIRKLSLWITGGAAAVSLGLGTAFAHALPGHSHPAAPPAGSTGTQRGSTAPRQPGTSQRPAAGHHPGTGTGRSHQHQLTPPQQQPAPAPAPTRTQPVVSGGS
jgi:hypothetical protein